MADRPALEEIKVTPEMIEAGVLELSRFNTDYETYADGVARILAAALAAEEYARES